MLKICHVIVGLGDGGAEKSLFKLIEADSANCHSVISLTDDGKYGPKLRDMGVTVESLNLRPQRLVRDFRKTLKLMKRQNPDVLHGWMPHACLAVSALAAFAPQPRVYWSIRASGYGPAILSISTHTIIRFLASISRKIPRKIFVVGRRAMEHHARLGFDRGKMVVVHNGFQLQQCHDSAKRPIKVQPGERRPTPLSIGMVARYHAQKDHLNLLEALAIVVQSQNVLLTLAGEGVTYENRKLARHIARLGLADYVSLLGPVENLDSIYERLDLHILSSAYGEGFPNVVAESMLAGVANIVTDVGEAADIVADTGWIVSPRSPSQLAETILSAIGEGPNQLAVRGERARERIATSFSLARMVEGHLFHYSTD